MTPGIHTITMAQYLADPCPEPSLSSSCAHTLITKSPAHAYLYHPRLGKASKDDSGVADIGSLAHDLLLGGEGKICVIDPKDYPAKNGNIPDGWTNTAIRAARDTARNNGLIPILANQYGAVKNMVKAARAFIDAPDSEIRGCLDNGMPEQTIIWREGSAWCRARPDWLTNDYSTLIHYKTTQASARPDVFIRGIMESMGYDMALAFYARGLEDALMEGATGADRAAAVTRHLILVQEQHPPYACSLIGLSPAKMAIANAKAMRAIRTWQSCLQSGRWPGYSAQVHYAEPTPWQMAQAEEMLMEDHAQG